ncbi:MAG TPA: hypothetical protein V6C95_23530 [Coleofasciculaceae cyanobacterium]
MTNFDDLLKGFKTQESEQTNLWTFTPTEQPKQTPEDKDLGRLEQDIHEIFSSRRFLNKVLVALWGVTGSTTCIHLFARLGIPALASGTLGGIAIALCFGNALTKVRIEGGKPHIDSEFFLALFQSLGVTGAMWVGARDYRQLNGLASVGRSEFLTEVKNFEIRPSSPDFGRLGTAGIGLLLLLMAIAILKGGKGRGY